MLDEPSVTKTIMHSSGSANTVCAGGRPRNPISVLPPVSHHAPPSVAISGGEVSGVDDPGTGGEDGFITTELTVPASTG